MSLEYLPEQAEKVRIALTLAAKEVAHLRYTYNTLYAETINLEWVKLLKQREDLSEKIDAFVGRFGRLQDHIGEKLLPSFVRLLGGQAKSLLDVVDYSERMGWLTSAEEFVGIRKLRNLLVHEYMEDEELFLESLLTAKQATELLFEIVVVMQKEALNRKLDL